MQTMREILKYRQQQFIFLGHRTHTVHLMLGNARNTHHRCIRAKKTEWRSLKRRTKQSQQDFLICPWTLCFLMADLSFPSCSPSLYCNHRFRLLLCCNQPTLFLSSFQTKTRLNDSICTAFIFYFYPLLWLLYVQCHNYRSQLMKIFLTSSTRWSNDFQLVSPNRSLLLMSFYLDTGFTG